MATKKAAVPGTAVAVKKPTAGNIVSIKEALKKQAAEMNDKVAPASGMTIQVTQDKQFKFPDGTSANSFNGVIVDFMSKNAFYPGKYDQKNIVPPVCFALGSNPLKMVPSNNSPELQSESCQACPNNEFGSAGDGKACKNARVLAVLPPDADEDSPIWLLNISPTALKAFDSYVRSIASVFESPPIAVVTTFSFDESKTYASIRCSDPQPNENIAAHFARQDDARKLLAVEPDVSKYEKPAAKPALKKVVNARR